MIEQRLLETEIRGPFTIGQAFSFIKQNTDCVCFFGANRLKEDVSKIKFYCYYSNEVFTFSKINGVFNHFPLFDKVVPIKLAIENEWYIIKKSNNLLEENVEQMEESIVL